MKNTRVYENLKSNFIIISQYLHWQLNSIWIQSLKMFIFKNIY